MTTLPTMDDQANELRQLVSQRSLASPPARGGTKLLVVAGGKGGVGTTTIALYLAAALAREGLRPVLVDADPDGGNAAMLCGLQERYTIADVLAGRRTVAEAVEAGPAGVRVLAGAWEVASLADGVPAVQQRLIGQLEGLGSEAGVVVVDVGDSRNRWARRFWQAADVVLLVATTELASITEAYASIKVLSEDAAAIRAELVINRADDPAAAEDVRRRLARACRRFLGIRLGFAGQIPYDPQLAAVASAFRPRALAASSGPAVRQLEQLATTAVAASDERGGRHNR